MAVREIFLRRSETVFSAAYSLPKPRATDINIIIKMMRELVCSPRKNEMAVVVRRMYRRGFCS
jgi:hypothetical protein